MKKIKRNSTARRSGHTGSTFDSFLEEEGLMEKVEAVAIKRVLAWQLSQAIAEARISKKALAEYLKTSRAQLDRLLDPSNAAVTLASVARAAHALGKRVTVTISDRKPPSRRSRKSAA